MKGYFMTKVSLIILIIIILISPFSNQVLSDDQPQRNKHAGVQEFKYDIYYFMSPTDKNLTRIYLHVGFCNDILQFVKESNFRFHAKYEMLFTIFDKKGNQVSGKTITDDIFVSSFAETNNRKLTNRIDYSVDLVANEYKLIIELTDSDTKKSLLKEKEIRVKGFQQNKLSLSDIIFTDQTGEDSLTIDNIEPNIERNFNNPETDFWAVFYIYPMNLDDPMTLIYTTREATSGDVVYTYKEEFTPSQWYSKKKINLRDHVKRVLKYSLVIDVKQKGQKASAEGKFFSSWNYFESADLSSEQTLLPLQNVIKGKEWKWLEQASDSSKDVWFKNYWKQRDPTPETEKNELKDEFYSRVSHSNSHFSVYSIEKEGWETDRGKIYIKYGAPSNIERRSNDPNIHPYEIWYYQGIERRFIFEDRSGFGDYILVKVE